MVINMIIKAMFYGVILGFLLAIVGSILGGSFDSDAFIGFPLLCGIGAIPVRKWIYRTFWI